MVALPYSGYKVSVTLTNDHNHPALTDQFFEWEWGTKPYESAVAPARTFGFVHEVEHLKKMGLIQGVDENTGIIVGHDRILTQLRFPNEMVRHKALDIIGDLALLGRTNMHIIAIRPSHKSNSKLCQELNRELII